MSSQDVSPFPPTTFASVAGRIMQESTYWQRVQPRRLPDASSGRITAFEDAVRHPPTAQIHFAPGSLQSAGAAGGSHNSIALPSRSCIRAKRPTSGESHSGLMITSIPLAFNCSSRLSRSMTRRLSMNCLSAAQ